MLTQEQIQRFEQDGFLAIKQLLSVEECEKLKSVANRLIDEWEPDSNYSWMISNSAEDEKTSSEFLMDSADKVSFFIEKNAVDPETGKLNRDKHQSVSRIGHALHKLVPGFKEVALSDKIKAIAHDVNFIKPAIRQTLYFHKPSLIGDGVTPHRDSQYAFNDPFKILGIWIALDDATVENGCLWFIPGSNSQTGQRRYKRNLNPNRKAGEELIYTGKDEQFDDSAFIPAEIKAGDALIFDGETVHKSEKNKSAGSRKVCAVHLVETHNSVYGEDNWLQPSEPFTLLYDE